MSKNDRYQNYPPEVVLKRVVKYAWKSRVLIGLSLLFLTIFTVLELFQPKLVSKLLDDYLLSVQTTWEKAGNEVLFENEYYQKKTENSDPDKLYTIVYYESKYILVDTEIQLDNANITLGQGVIDSIGNKDITVSADKIEGVDRENIGLDADKLAQVGNNPIYNFTINDGNDNISQFGDF